MHADDLHVLAVVLIAGAALITMIAGDVGLCCYTVSLAEAGDATADGHHIAGELVAEHHGHRYTLRGPVIPAVDMLVGTADCRHPHFHQYFIVLGHRYRQFAA